MHTRLTIPERLKDLRVAEKRMSLQELSDATGIPSSTLGNYEKDENVKEQKQQGFAYLRRSFYADKGEEKKEL